MIGIGISPTLGQRVPAIPYLLGPFRFSTDQAAPLASPYSEAGAVGSLLVSDTSSVGSISGGRLAVDGSAGANYRSAVAAASRGAGTYAVAVTIERSINTADANVRLVFGNNAEQVRLNGTSLRVQGDLLTDAVNGLYYEVLLVPRSVGSYALLRPASSGAWTLAWVNNSTTTVPQPHIGTAPSAATRITYFDNFRGGFDLATLEPRFATDYALATSRLVTPSAGATATHTADCLLDFTVTTLPSSGFVVVRFRRQDSTNFWEVRCLSTGDIHLRESVAGVDTARGSASAVLANGHRVVVVAEGSTIKVYSNNTIRMTYSSATNFQTSTDLLVASLGTGGALSEVVAFPRTVTLGSF